MKRGIFLVSLLSATFLITACDPGDKKLTAPVPANTKASQKQKDPCYQFAPWGYPRFNPPQKNVFLCNEGYAGEFNPRSRTMMWVAENLKRTDLDQKTAYRQNDFRPDPRLTSSPLLTDYAGSGYDRGHLAPAEDFRENAKKMSQSFYLSNMIPQNPQNNRGLWAKLEQNTRNWAMQYNQAYVITGPIYYQGVPLGFLGKGGEVRLMDGSKGKRGLHAVEGGRVAIPTHIYKIVYAPQINQMIAFIVPNTEVNPADLPKYRVTVSTVESLTGLSFFPEMDYNNQRALKNQIPLWQIK